MRRRRQQKLEKKLQQFRSRDGGTLVQVTRVYCKKIAQNCSFKYYVLIILTYSHLLEVAINFQFISGHTPIST